MVAKKENIICKIKEFFEKNYRNYNNSGYAYYYENLENQYKSDQLYLDFKTNLESKIGKQTKTPIRLSKTFSSFEASIKEVISKFGKPIYRLKLKKNIFEFEILFYRLNLGKYKAKLELHFHKKKLFAFHYTFSNFKPHQISELTSVIKEKYLNNKDLDFNNEYIIDDTGSTIELSQNINFTITYTSTQNEIFLALEERLKSIKDNKRLQAKRNIEVLKRRL